MEYIKHLWHGDRSLPFTFWVICVIGNIFLNILSLVYKSQNGIVVTGSKAGQVLDSFGFYEPITGVTVLFVLLLAFLVVTYFGFTAVCVWRSANEYRGKAIWSTLAKVVVAIGTMRAVLLLDGEISLLF
ncbi:hypothetical protein M1N14_01135 [Dehalococcoidia bacterium]|nr:hypothetical protein [Dehalococcoidia bacterium]